MKLRVGEPQTFPVHVTALRNLPLDLYILMDLSRTMGSVLNNIKMVSSNISKSATVLSVYACSYLEETFKMGMVEFIE